MLILYVKQEARIRLLVMIIEGNFFIFLTGYYYSTNYLEVPSGFGKIK